MKKAEVIVLKKKGFDVDAAYMAKLYEVIKPSIVSMAMVDPIEKPYIIPAVVTENLEKDHILKQLADFKDSQILMHFGEAPIHFNVDEECQPFVLSLNEEGKPALICMIEGPLSEFAEGKGEHSEEFQAFKEYILPGLDAELDRCTDYNSFVEKLNKDKVLNNYLNRFTSNRGMLVLMDARDNVWHFGPGPKEMAKDFEWGSVTQHLGFGAVGATGEGVKPGDRLNTLAAKFRKLTSDNTSKSAPAAVPQSVVPTVKEAETKQPVGFVPFSDKKEEPKVKDAAMAAAASVNVPKAEEKPKDLSSTHVKMAPPSTIKGNNKTKRWYRDYSHDHTLPENWDKRPQVWVSKEDAEKLKAGVAKGQANVKSFQDLKKVEDKPTPAAQQQTQTKDTVAKHIAAPQSAVDEPMPVISSKAKDQFKVFDDQMHKLKVLDHASRAILSPEQYKAEPKMPTFMDISGYELHELLRIPHEMRKKLIAENPEMADAYMHDLIRHLASRMTAEELNPAIEADEDKYKADTNDKEVGAIPSVSNTTSGSGARRRFAMG